MFCLLLMVIPLSAEIPRGLLIPYIKAERAAGRVPDIKMQFGLNLWGTDFSKLDLTDIDFSHTDLGDCKFHGSTLKKANFNQANIYLAEFHEADLRQAIFIDCELDRCSFDRSDLRQSLGFGDSTMMRVSAVGANFSGLDLSRCDLSDIDFSHANLSNCVLSRADVSSSNFKGAKITNVKADNVFLLNAHGLTKQQIASLEASGAIGSQITMEQRIRDGFQFKEMNLSDANLDGFNLNGADFAEADLSGASLRNCQLNGAIFEGATINSVSFDGSSLRASIFDHSESYYARYDNTDLTDSTFRNASLFQASFERAICDGVNFTGAEVSLADFRNAKGNSHPSLEYMHQQSGLTWHTFLTNLRTFLATMLPLAGAGALVAMIICSMKMYRDRGQKRWVVPTLWATYAGMISVVFSMMLALDGLGDGVLLFMLGAMTLGPIVCLFGAFLGISHLAHGRKQRHWPSIIFFLCAPIPTAGILAIFYNILASV